MKIKNDFAKSILDSPYNRVEGGRKIELADILDKYRYQRQNRQLSNLDAYAEDLGKSEEGYRRRSVVGLNRRKTGQNWHEKKHRDFPVLQS